MGQTSLMEQLQVTPRFCRGKRHDRQCDLPMEREALETEQLNPRDP